MAWFLKRRKGGTRRSLAPRQREALLLDALRAVVAEEWEAAERPLAELARADSGDVEPYLVLGRVFRERGEIGRAIRVHQNLLLRPDVGDRLRVDGLVELAADLRAGGFLERATASLEDALARDPRRPRAWAMLADLREQTGAYQAAIAARQRQAKLERWSREDRDREESRLRLGLARQAHEGGRHDDARKEVRRALKRDQRNAEAHLLLGRIEAERGRSKAALEAWRRIPELDRHRAATVYPLLASSFAALDRGPEFESLLRAALERDPADADARLALARAQIGRGQVDAAISDLRRVLESEPGRLDVRAELGRLLLAEGRDPEALKSYAELIDVLSRAAGSES